MQDLRVLCFSLVFEFGFNKLSIACVLENEVLLNSIPFIIPIEEYKFSFSNKGMKLK